MFRALARVLVPRLADWCSVHLRDGGQPQPVAVAHADPDRLAQAQRLQTLPVAPDTPHGLGYVLRTGTGELIPAVSDDMLVATAGSDEHLHLARDLTLSSVVTVPLTGRTGVFGAIQLCYGESGRRYDRDDLRLLEDLAARAAVAADNARAYARQAGRQQRSEAALRQSEDRFRLLVDSATDYAIFMLDPHGRVLTWNPGAQRIKGYTADEIIGEHFRRFYPPAAQAAHHPEHELEDRCCRRPVHRSRAGASARTARRFWANVDHHGAAGRARHALIGFGTVTRDLTERRDAEEALRRNEERFRLLVDSATDYAIFMLDPHGRVLTWNSGAQRIIGYTADEIIGGHFRRFHPPEAQAAPHPEHELQIAAAAGRYTEQGWRVRRDGTLFWAHIVITALRDAHGNLIGFGQVTREAPGHSQ